MENNIDVLIIGAHPDDAELSCGGTIAKLVKNGKSVVIADCTAGELGTRGTPETRLQEAENAGKILGIKERVNLGMEDGNILYTIDNMLKIVKILRKYKPNMTIMHPPFERHPDHENVHRLVRHAMFKSGLVKIETHYEGKLQDRFRSRKMYCYLQSYTFQKQPSFYVDISDVHDIKIESIKAYQSQIYVPGRPDTGELETRLSYEGFLEDIEARARYFGHLTGVKYAEAFWSVEPVVLKNLSELL